MGLFDFLRRLFFPAKTARQRFSLRSKFRRKPRTRPRLVPLHYAVEKNHRRREERERQTLFSDQGETSPYRFARWGRLDLSGDTNHARLQRYRLPIFSTPDELADWLGLPVGQLAWLIHRSSPTNRPESVSEAHYHYHWTRKRRAGYRLIEAPKRILKAVQRQILREILDQVPIHPSAHGFCPGRSIVTNARPHVGQVVLLKFDLENFFPAVTFSRVVAVFRGLGYSREAAIWLANLATSALPANIPFPNGNASAILPFLPRHLPQGAPTSPALANLSAYSLDVRLSGLARSFGAGYTRYADDLTFSGPEPFIGSLRTFIPLVGQIIRSERFRANREKRKVIRDNQRQTVTGVVVNEKINVARRDFDRLKAILHNCRRLGPASQNREGHEDFAAQLRGRIAHVRQLNPQRGEKLLNLYRQISW